MFSLDTEGTNLSAPVRRQPLLFFDDVSCFSQQSYQHIIMVRSAKVIRFLNGLLPECFTQDTSNDQDGLDTSLIARDDEFSISTIYVKYDP